nr:GCN5-related N-acetyltransferase [uncultured bacterium]
MPFEIRTLTDDDMARAVAISSYSFNAPDHWNNAERIERARKANRPDWYVGTFEDGAMTSMMVILPVEMYLNGAAIPFGAVSPVATAPEHRRKGHAGQMLRKSLEVMRDRGQLISGLTTPHPALYRRYGWEISADRHTYTFAPKDLHLTSMPKQRGGFEMLTSNDWPLLAEVHQVYAERNNGPFRRSEHEWRWYRLELPWDPISDVVLWRDDAGTAQGYALYNQPVGGPNDGKVVVLEFVALTGDAYKNLAIFFATHDISREIRILASPADALTLLFADADRVTVGSHYTVMLRVCDFEAAMRLRPAGRDDETCEVTVSIRDTDAPWNAGVWRAGVAEGRSWAERSEGNAELSVEARMLGPLYNGYMKPSTAAAAGLIEATDDDALVRADRIFAARQAPFFIDTF